MPKSSQRRRIDVVLVERGLAESRERAQALVMAGEVLVDGRPALKPGEAISPDAAIQVKERLPYVSRGGFKLARALDAWGLDVAGAIALDVGASTGGFTDVLLQRGAARVYAVDVGHGQLAYKLRADPRVVSMEGVNARHPFDLPKTVDILTADVSFISLTLVLPEAARHLKPGGYIIALVKPQFEARREEVGRGGVVRDPQTHAAVIARVVRWAIDAGFRVRGLIPSPITGDAGNREFLLLLQKEEVAPAADRSLRHPQPHGSAP